MTDYECKYRHCPHCQRVKVGSIWAKEPAFIWVCKCPGRADDGFCYRCGGM